MNEGMVDISKYFPEESIRSIEHGIVLYEFDESRTEEFIQEMLVPIREAFVSDTQIDKEIVYKHTRDAVITSHFPTTPELKSADFGEALTYYFASWFFDPRPNVCPMKLRFRDDYDKPTPRTDVMLFYVTDPTVHSADDVMYSIEIKSHATTPSTESSINNAIVDANKDKTSRAAETIPYLLNRISAIGEPLEMYEGVARFDHPYEETYKKSYNAVAVIDKADLQKHLDNIEPTTIGKLSTEYAGINIFCLPIAQMKRIYERLYELMPNT